MGIVIGLILFAAIVAISSVQVLRSSFYFVAWRIYTDAPIEKGFANNHDVHIRYATYGDGPPLVLLHGRLSSSLDWIGEIPALAQSFKVVAIDLRGHAGSTIGNEKFTYHLLASDVVAVLDALDVERASLAGWSDGGNVGLLFALNYPNRIDRLIAISANFNPEGVADDVMHQIVDAPEQAGSGLARCLYRMQSPTPDAWPMLQNRVTSMWQNLPRDAPAILIDEITNFLDRAHH